MGGGHPKLSTPTVVNNGMMRNQTLMSLSGHNNQAVVAVGVSNAPGSNDNITHASVATQIGHSNPLKCDLMTVKVEHGWCMTKLMIIDSRFKIQNGSFSKE